MSTYNFYTNAVLQAGGGKPPTATPGDTSELKVRRATVDTTKQSLSSGDIAQAVPIYAGEIVLDFFAWVKTADTTTNCAVDLGFEGGAQGGANLAGIKTVNTVLHNATFVPLYFSANNYVTLTPQNSVAIDAAVVEVCAVVTKAFGPM